MKYLTTCRAEAWVLITWLGLSGITLNAQGYVARQIRTAKAAEARYISVNLLSLEPSTSHNQALWSEACRKAEVFRYDEQAAIELIAATSQHITLTIPTETGPLLLDLELVSLYADGFSVHRSSDGRAEYAPASAHYRGMVRGDSTSVVAISVFGDQMMGLVADSSGQRVLGRLKQGPHANHVLYWDQDLLASNSFVCGTTDEYHVDTLEAQNPQLSDRSNRCVRFYWEAAYDIYLDKGGTVNTINYLTGLFNQCATLFANDGITVTLQEIYIWNTASPYSGTRDERLCLFGQLRTNFNGDLGHLLDYGNDGGVAWLNTLCSGMGSAAGCANTNLRTAYSGIQGFFSNVPTYSWSVHVVTHETGHNLGSRHTHACAWNGNNTAIDGCGQAVGYSEGTCAQGTIPSSAIGGTIMSYCHLLNDAGINLSLGFGPQPSQLILQNIEDAPCLSACDLGQVDCNGIPGGGTWPGMTCSDDNPCTINDVLDAACNCIGLSVAPLAIANSGGQSPILACQEEIITFDASSSTAAPGFELTSYSWMLDDGTTGTGPVIEHSYSSAASYLVQLSVTDNNGCTSATPATLPVLISTTPLFHGTTGDTTICEGQSIELIADAFPVTGTTLPEATIGGGGFIPDLNGVPFSSTLTFTHFLPGQTLTNAAEIVSTCATMEHSFMGDLVIAITCPNGQLMVMHQQGGGGTDLGEPVLGENSPELQGECYNYCWSPTATNGTWADNSGGTLEAGTYESIQPFSNLIGCPLNGEWTFTITDLFASENGFLCDWSINFDPILFPTPTTYTPTVGQSSDSVLWLGTSISTNPDFPWGAVFNADSAGIFDLTFVILDNFGCSYDTTITVTVASTPAIIPIEWPEAVSVNDTVQFSIAPLDFATYTWSFPDSWIPNTSTGPLATTSVSGPLGTDSVCVQVELGLCRTDTCRAVDIGVGIADRSNERRVIISVDPNTNLLQIAYTGEILRFYLFDSVGHLALDLGLRPTGFTTNLTNLSSGIYVLLWDADSTRGMSPIIVH